MLKPGVTQRRAVFHQRRCTARTGRVLLVRRQVGHQIPLRDQVFVGADPKAVLVALRQSLPFVDRFFAQGIGIRAGIAHVDPGFRPGIQPTILHTFRVAGPVNKFVARAAKALPNCLLWLEFNVLK